ncbi:MAG: hypothetical protein ACLFUU_03910 [Desulfobacteraceae bacterium]
MEIKYIIATLIMSDFYLTMPLKERKALVHRLHALYGQHSYDHASGEPGSESPFQATVQHRE